MKNLKFIAVLLSLLLTMGATDSLAQTKKTTRKKPVLKKTTVVKKVPVVPAVKLYTVETGQKLRVRLNNTLN